MSKRKGKHVEAGQRQFFEQRTKCDCMALQHNLINNCLNCGRVVCQRQGQGPCFFCKSKVLRNVSTFLDVDNQALFPTLGNELRQAVSHRDKLVSKDNQQAPKQNIFDEQTDYYQLADNKWAHAQDRTFAINRIVTQNKSIKKQQYQNHGYYDIQTKEWVSVKKEHDGEAFKRQAQEYILAKQSKELSKKVQTLQRHEGSRMAADYRLSKQIRDVFKGHVKGQRKDQEGHRVAQNSVQIQYTPEES